MSHADTAIVLIPDHLPKKLIFHKLYGGETLFGRCLVAISKSGIKNAIILCTNDEQSDVKNAISRIQSKRLVLSVEVREKTGTFGEQIDEISTDTKAPLMIVPVQSILHPTLLKQLTSDISKSFVPVYDHAYFEEHTIKTTDGLKNKFKVQFEGDGWLPITANSDQVMAVGAGKLVSGPIVILSPGDAELSKAASSFEDFLVKLAEGQKLFIRKINDAWWLPIVNTTTDQQIREVFWKVAFKEISGEFSKAVNSKLSRPLSLWLADREVAPDTISNASLALFLLSSLLLLIPDYWALVTFAIIWQLSAGVLDRCDGEVARIRNYESEHGGRFDMIIDDLRFLLPFLFLGAMLTYQNNILYLIPLVLILVWTLALTLYEQSYMLKTGYTSRQVLYVDYLKLIGEKKSESHKKYLPLIKGDIRTFYVTILCFVGHRPTVFLVLSAYLTIVPVVSYFGIQKFKKAGIG